MSISDVEVLDMTVLYFRIYASGLVFQFSYNVVAAVLRSVGDSKATLYFLVISSVIDIGLDLVFVPVFGWGVAGSAISDVIAEFVSMVASIVYMFKKYPVFRFKLRELVFEKEKCGICLKLGIPSTIQYCVISVGNGVIQRLVNTFGRVTMSAFTVGVKIENYVMLPITTLSTGMATFTGQNIGAGKLDRVKRGWRGVLIMALGISTLVSACTYIFAVPLSRLFGVSGDTLGQSVEYIHFMAFCFPMLALYMTNMGVLQGSGDTIYATFCSLSTIVVRAIAAFIMVYSLGVGYSFIWKSVPIGWLFCGVFALTRYLSGAWRKKAIVKADETKA
jgi:putative MATE family efflux protein